MRRRPPRALALPAAVALIAICATPAFAVPATTPVPGPANPGQPPASAPIGPQPLGHAVGDAGGGLAVIRLLPNSVPTGTILPDLAKQLPKQPTAEAGFGLSSAQVNSQPCTVFWPIGAPVTESNTWHMAYGGVGPHEVPTPPVQWHGHDGAQDCHWDRPDADALG
jgi:hypothetical protein